MRIPYAMRTLIDELDSVDKQALIETFNPDGFGVWRSLALHPAIADKVGALLNELSDTRIASKGLHLDGRYIIHFVSDTRADNPKAFAIDRAYRILVAEEGQPTGSTAVDRETLRLSLARTPVARLRRTYDFPNGMKKAEIIKELLAREGF